MVIFRGIKESDVTLIQCSSDSLVIYNAAKLSHGQYWQDPPMEERIQFYKKLITAGHLSVFEHCSITYLVNAPIFVLRQIMRHRTAKYTERSGRYSMPNAVFWKSREWDNRSDNALAKIIQNSERDCELYAELSKSMPLEDARTLLPVSLYSEVYMTFDLRNLMHFFDLRLSKSAQRPTREIAEMMFNLFVVAFEDVATAYASVKGYTDEDGYLVRFNGGEKDE